MSRNHQEDHPTRMSSALLVGLAFSISGALTGCDNAEPGDTAGDLSHRNGGQDNAGQDDSGEDSDDSRFAVVDETIHDEMVEWSNGDKATPLHEHLVPCGKTSSEERQKVADAAEAAHTAGECFVVANENIFFSERGSGAAFLVEKKLTGADEHDEYTEHGRVRVRISAHCPSAIETAEVRIAAEQHASLISEVHRSKVLNSEVRAHSSARVFLSANQEDGDSTLLYSQSLDNDRYTESEWDTEQLYELFKVGIEYSLAYADPAWAGASEIEETVKDSDSSSDFTIEGVADAVAGRLTAEYYKTKGDGNGKTEGSLAGELDGHVFTLADGDVLTIDMGFSAAYKVWSKHGPLGSSSAEAKASSDYWLAGVVKIDGEGAGGFFSYNSDHFSGAVDSLTMDQLEAEVNSFLGSHGVSAIDPADNPGVAAPK